MFVVDAPLLVLGFEAFFGGVFALAVQADDALGLERSVGIDERVQRVRTIFEDEIAAAAYDDARAFFRQVKNDFLLDNVQIIVNAHAAQSGALTGKGAGQIGEDGIARRVLAVFFDKLGRKAGFVGDFFDEFLVVAGDAQLFAQLTADGSAAAAEFAAEGDDVLIPE